MAERAKRICFLGKNGIGKSVVVSNISQALCRKGYRVLQVGNDISMSSTLLLLQEQPIRPMLEDFRDHYAADLAEYAVQSPGGVYCMELGGITPGAGCMARSLCIADELIEEQDLAGRLGLDYILYDISGEIPCTGYILPLRDGIMDQCVVLATGSFSSLFVANHLITGILHARRRRAIPISLLVNYADRRNARALLESYSRKTGTHVIGYLNYYQQVEDSVLAGTTVFEGFPGSESATHFEQIAQGVIEDRSFTCPEPMERDALRAWSSQWKHKRLECRENPACRDSCTGGGEYSGNT